MNKEQAIKYLPLIQALAEGKKLECRTKSITFKNPNDGWVLTREPLFNESNEYRIKPIIETRTGWMNVYEDHNADRGRGALILGTKEECESVYGWDRRIACVPVTYEVEIPQ